MKMVDSDQMRQMKSDYVESIKGLRVKRVVHKFLVDVLVWVQSKCHPNSSKYKSVFWLFWKEQISWGTKRDDLYNGAHFHHTLFS